MTDWSAIARATIQAVAVTLPDDMPLAERLAAVDAAYPFGERERWPYKAWLAARKRYLRRFGYIGRGKPEPVPLLEPHLSPLERMAKATAEAGRC